MAPPSLGSTPKESVLSSFSQKQSNDLMGINALAEPLQRLWSDGRSVLIYPDGSVLDRATGRIVKAGKALDSSLLRFLLQILIRNSSEISFWDTQVYTLAGTAAQQIVSTSKPTKFVRLKAGTANAGTLYVGGPNVSSTTSTMPLVAGQIINIAITDLSLLWFIGTDTDTIAYTVTQ